MFSKSIILSDAFLDMPATTRCLYFTLSLLADDEGFVNSPRAIMRQSGATEDDMRLLISKKFVIVFDDGVVVIKHWRIHNYIQKDRYTPTKYVEHREALFLDKNNAYTLNPEGAAPELPEPKELTPAQQARIEARKESDLPYSFDYKIRQAFDGEKCPVCGGIMRLNNDFCAPSVQHNKPISLGGKHEIGNISIICRSCNSRIQDRETEAYNSADVAKKWAEICGCEENVYIPDTQDRIGKDRIELNIEKENIKEKKKTTAARFAPPTPAEVAEYCTTAAITIDAEAFCDYYTANGWRVGRQPMKDWKAAARNWARRDATEARRGATPAGTRKNTTGFSGTGYEPPEGATDGLDAFFAASLNRAKKGD